LDPVQGASFRHIYFPTYPSVIFEGLQKETLSKNIIQDEWGSWISGFIPLYNSDNKIVAAVGVDFKADNIIDHQIEIAHAVIPVFVISYIVLLATVIFFSNRTVEPVISLSKAAAQIGEGKLAFVDRKPQLLRDEISTLTEVFNAMAEKVHVREEELKQLSEQLRLFHQASIDLREEEKTALALNIHDDLLSQLAVFSMNSSALEIPEIQDDFDNFTNRVRQIMTSLRPVMLDYGLRLALEEYVDEFSNRVGIETEIVLDMPSSDIRYDSKVEEHLYRIVQQACENALRHAGAETIRIEGKLTPEKVIITIIDNGIGLNIKLDFNSLIVSRHFGLASMFERAALIDAEIVISSTPEQGTHISLTWEKPNEYKF